MEITSLVIHLLKWSQTAYTCVTACYVDLAEFLNALCCCCIHLLTISNVSDHCDDLCVILFS